MTRLLLCTKDKVPPADLPDLSSFDSALGASLTGVFQVFAAPDGPGSHRWYHLRALQAGEGGQVFIVHLQERVAIKQRYSLSFFF